MVGKILAIIFILFSGNLFAGKDGAISTPMERLKEYQVGGVVRSHARHICDLSKKYDLSYKSLAALLSRQNYYYGPEDALQDWFIGRGDFFDEEDLRELNYLYRQNLWVDTMNRKKGLPQPSRNSWDSFLFSSLGPAQIQIYQGRQLAEHFNFGGEEQRKDFNFIAKSLSKPETGIEFLAMEMRRNIDIYQDILDLDISEKTEALWQLHNSGSVIYRALSRLEKRRMGMEPALSGADNNQLIAIEQFFAEKHNRCQ